MLDPHCDLAALVYESDQDPDELLRGFASDLKARGSRVVGLVHTGHDCADAQGLSAMLVHSGEELQLFQDLGACATGCRLDVGQLLDAGGKVASAIDAGADLVIVNRFGRQEREGKGLSYLIERALSAEIPVVIAVPSHSRLLTNDYRLDAAVAPISSLVLQDGFEKMLATEIGPECRCYIDLGIGDLPQKKIADAHLTAGPNQ